ncbi:hypothetical protein BTA51_09680 [Hahella sp. CCB-MM4]|uniref:carboxylesterase family protein n=1 Tax=Hahella sp. (strain CCB-MM4) TaxID=1926491 RepID=UPI000B9C09B5|nr:hypothetical protein [Hahella sp. CCB-MM4]OZG74033.1 hypothetical protein BTA51_09680 [Hahella sp. CCB-MM4]
MKILTFCLFYTFLFLSFLSRAELVPVNGMMESPRTFNGFVHFPSNYDPVNVQGYPLLIAFHGLGECGDATINNGDGTYSLDMDILSKTSNVGPARLIRDGLWDESLPMIVLAPQLPAGSSGICGMYKDRYEKIYNHAIANYNVDLDRVYVTGLSQGGNGTYNVLRDRPDTIAAAVPIAAWYPQEFDCEAIHHIAVWAFHGDQDKTVGYNSGKSAIDKKLNGCGDPDYPPRYPAKLTSFAGIGHNSWDGAYGVKEDHVFRDGNGDIIAVKNYFLELAYDHLDSHVDAAGNYGGDGYYYHYNEFGRYVVYHWLLSFSRNADDSPGPGDGQYLLLSGEDVHWDAFRIFRDTLWQGDYDLPAMGVDTLVVYMKNLGVTPLSKLYIHLNDAVNKKDLGFNVENYASIGDDWVRIAIPLADFVALGVDIRHFHSARLFIGPNASMAMAVDEIRFEGPANSFVLFGRDYRSQAFKANGNLSAAEATGEDVGD